MRKNIIVIFVAICLMIGGVVRYSHIFSKSNLSAHSIIAPDVSTESKTATVVPSKNPPVQAVPKKNPTPNPSVVDTSVKISKIVCEDFYKNKILISCKVSPDGQFAIGQAYANEGIRLISAATRKVDVLSTPKHDLALLWFSDSKRVLGFTGSVMSFDCAGKITYCPPEVPDNRAIVTWYPASAIKYRFMNIATPKNSFDMEWIVPDHTAYIYTYDLAGPKGANFYYILDLDNNIISGPTKNPELR